MPFTNILVTGMASIKVNLDFRPPRFYKIKIAPRREGGGGMRAR